MFTGLVVASAVLASLIGGVFYAFSTFIMRALDDQPVPAGVAAMQRINVTVINPLFIGPFFGTAVLLAASAYASLAAGRTQCFIWLIASFLVYAAGSIGVTMCFNVPRNSRLAALSSTSSAAATYWPLYVQQWTFWNHVRTGACLAAGIFGIVGLTIVDVG